MRREIIVVLILILTTSFSVFSQDFTFASIENLIEQEIARIVLPQIYDKIGYTISVEPKPARRAQYEAVKGIVDGEILRIWTYGIENPNLIRVPTPYYHLETMAFFLKDSNIQITTKDDLSKYKIAKVRGVKHTNNITEGLDNILNFSGTEQMFRFLIAGRADIALTNTNDGLVVIQANGFENIRWLSEPLATLDLYHYVNEEQIHLIDKIDAVIQEMKENGELEKITREAEMQLGIERITDP
jgi:ABC-type amino acid transport substrate-binding protein